MGYRRYYYRRRSNTGERLLIGIGALFLTGIFISFLANPVQFLSNLLGLGVFAGIVILGIKGIPKLWHRGDRSMQSEGAYLGRRAITEINSEKHGCKCYMEGLSDSEKKVADTLSYELSYKDYFIFNNLIIPFENNVSTQIDHVVVSRFGIFVIETKDYKGWIFGDSNQPSWTQSLPGGRNKFSFQNPIHQNYAHIMALKALMPFASDAFYSIVVFTDKSEIKSVPIENVVRLNQLIGCIKKYTQQRLSEGDVQLAIGKLSYACQTVNITTSEHIENLRANHPSVSHYMNAK